MERWKDTNNTDRTLYIAFSKVPGFYVHNNPEAETQRSFAPLDYCERKNLYMLKRRHLVFFMYCY